MVVMTKKSWTIKFCVLVFTVIVAVNGSSLRAEEGDIEFYSSRPGIESIEASNDELSNKQIKLFTGVVNYIAQMRAFYPDSVFYVLARDGEAMFDLWQILYPQDFKEGRVKLINISRTSNADPNLKAYVQSTGLIEDIERGRHVIALDTGYEGSIVDTINGMLKRKGKLYAHLMSAAHMQIPSSRVSTRPFLASALRKKEIEDDDPVSEAAEMAVEALEGIHHYTATATAYAKLPNGTWDATSEEVSADEKRKALKFMGRVKRFATDNKVRNQAKRSSELFGRVMAMLRSDEPVRTESLNRLMSDLDDAELEDVWDDLRESVGKGTVAQFNVLRYKEIFDHLPAELKSLADVWDEDGLITVKEREEEIEKLAQKMIAAQPKVKQPAQQQQARGAGSEPDNDFWVADIIRLYLKGVEEADQLQAIYDNFQANKAGFYHPSSGGNGSIGKKLGEGVRSDVHRLGDRDIIKMAYDAEDMPALEGEKLVFDFLMKNSKKYPLRLLEITEMGERGIYLIKPRVEKDTIGKYILRNNGALTQQQMRSLEEVYTISRQLAIDTGISLDIKADNLVWTNKGWVVLDLGARTMSHPYFFTLECKNFAQYLEIWNSDSESRTGVMDVEDYITNSRRKCEAAVINGYRELKADN